jgi:hypothetical protein
MQGRNANGSGDDPPRLVSCRRPSSTRTRDALLPKNTQPLAQSSYQLVSGPSVIPAGAYARKACSASLRSLSS